MSLPKYNDLYGCCLKMLEDDQIHDLQEIKGGIAQNYSLTGEELSERLPSGKQTVFANRVGWALTYLKKAGLINNPSTGKYVLTDSGREALPDADSIDNKYLKKYEAFRDFISIESVTASNIQENTNLSLEEIFEDSFKAINTSFSRGSYDRDYEIISDEF